MIDGPLDQLVVGSISRDNAYTSEWADINCISRPAAAWAAGNAFFLNLLTASASVGTGSPGHRVNGFGLVLSGHGSV